jgi:predicted nucleic acid-binding protein
MPDLVIADASVLIIFDKIERLDILRDLYQEILTTPEISGEFQKSLPDWIKVKPPGNKKYQKLIENHLDVGEASAIALAMEDKESLIILDDLRARKYAKRLGIKITGTLGVINKAKETGIIEKIKPVIENLIEKDFRVSKNIIQNLLERNNE